MADFNTQILPPIIDNTISAFVFDTEATSNKGLEVVFYHQSQEIGDEAIVEQNQILVQLYANQQSILKEETLLLQAQVVNDFANSSRSNTKYKCIISANMLKDEKFKINTQMTVRLASIKKDANALIEYANGEDSWSNIYNQYKAEFSQWSESAIKYALPPLTFSITGNGFNLNPNEKYEINDLIYSPYKIMGTLSFGDKNEEETDTLAWYQIQFVDSSVLFQNTVLDSTNGQKYPNDLSRREFEYEFTEIGNKATESRKVRMAVLFKTVKGYQGSQIYEFIGSSTSDDSQSTEKNQNTALSFVPVQGTKTLLVEKNPTHGSFVLKYKLQYEKSDKNTEPYFKGTFIYQKGRKKENIEWHTFYEETVIFYTDQPLERTFEDITAEAGVPCCYRVLFKYQTTEIDENDQEVTKDVYAVNRAVNIEPNILFFDGAFLATKELAMRVLYNSTISNYKHNIQTVVTPTLGGKFPFIRRGGHQNYRTFSLSGLISFNSELYQGDADYLGSLFTSNSSIDNSLSGQSKDIFAESLFINTKQLKDIDMSYLKDLPQVDRDAVVERLFREKVIDFLYSDAVILFKSFTEGNIFVRLTDVSFTPNEQLSRNIWSFSATATEVLDASCSNYLEYFGETRYEKEYVLTEVLLKVEELNTSENASDIINTAVMYKSQTEISEDHTETVFNADKITTSETTAAPVYAENSFTETISFLSLEKGNSTEEKVVDGQTYYVHTKTVAKSNLAPELVINGELGNEIQVTDDYAYAGDTNKYDLITPQLNQDSITFMVEE